MTAPHAAAVAEAGGLPTARIHQILGGNALDLLARVL
jgi:hypothetical protein